MKPFALFLLLLAILPCMGQSEEEVDRIIERLATGDLIPAALSLSQRNQLLVVMAQRLMKAEGRALPEQPEDSAKAEQAPQVVGPNGEDPKEMFREVHQLLSHLEMASAAAKTEELLRLFPQAKDSLLFKKLQAEVAIIGKDAGTLRVARWYQEQADFNTFPVTLVIFWETWCPHCQEEMPKIEALYKRYQDQGLGVIGLTKVRPPANNTAVVSFMVEKNISFPMGMDSGEMSEYFGAVAVPAAVLIKNQKVIWRGNPSRINEVMLEKALAD